MNRYELPFPPAELDVSDKPLIDAQQIVAVARRNIFLIGGCAGVGVILALVYLLVASPQYTSSAKILLDRTTVGANGQGAEVVLDTGAVDSQVEVLKSERVADEVIRQLGLQTVPEFNRGRSVLGVLLSGLRWLASPSEWFGEREKSEQEAAAIWRETARTKFSAALDVQRVGRTFVLNVDYTDTSPFFAATMANSFAEAYIADQLEARFDIAKVSGSWLLERLNDLKAQSITADLAVQRFKAQNNLVSTDGRPVDEQQLSQINAAFVAAHNDTMRARARYERVQEILQQGDMDAAVAEALSSPVINVLRDRYLKVLKTRNSLVTTLGPTHLQIKNLESEMAEYHRQIFEELRRISESYKSEYDIAASGERSLMESLKGIVGVNAANNEMMVQLRARQSEADSLKRLYEFFLNKYQEVMQFQSRPIAEARIISSAFPTITPTKPKKAMIAALGLIGGLALGAGFALLRVLNDRGFRRRQSVRETLGVECLSLLPRLGPDVKKTLIGEMLSPFEHVGARRASRPRPSGDGVVMLDYSVNNPNSLFSEGLRGVKIAVDAALADKSTKIIGFVSTFPGEGKTTTSKNFASLLASLGARVLLIDGDLRHYALTRSLAPSCETGLLEAFEAEASLDPYLIVEASSGLKILPFCAGRRRGSTSEIIASERMRALLAKGSQTFDYIILDLPPLASVVDVKAASGLFDAFVYVVEWAATPRESVAATLAEHPKVLEKCVGAVLNKVDMNELRLYDYNTAYYYSRSAYYYIGS